VVFLPPVEFRRPTAELAAAACDGQALSGATTAESGLQFGGQRQALRRTRVATCDGGYRFPYR